MEERLSENEAFELLHERLRPILAQPRQDRIPQQPLAKQGQLALLRRARLQQSVEVRCFAGSAEQFQKCFRKRCDEQQTVAAIAVADMGCRKSEAEADTLIAASRRIIRSGARLPP